MAFSTIAGWAVSTIGSSVVENLVSEAYSFLRDPVLPADCEAELQRLQMALPQISAVMDIAEALKLKHPSAGPWVEKYRRALEASEDVLDEIEYKRLEDMVKNRDEAGGSASCSKKQKSSPVGDDTLKRLREAVRMLDQAAAGVSSLLQLAIVLGVRDPSESFLQVNKVLKRETTSFLVEEKVFGRDVEKDKIISWLKRPTEQPLSSFGIVGMGGLGKTTLAQLAYQEMRGSNHFNQTIWVCVSIGFSVEGITRKILDALDDNSCDNAKSLNALQEALKEKIQSKKIFLVLDDVWDDVRRRDWEQLIAPVRYVKYGSKILFTTRMQSVANLLGRVVNIEYESLTLRGMVEEELRLLFNSYAFYGANPDDHNDLQSIGNQIIKMLLGSPLAAKVIGSLVNSQLDYGYWRRILKCGSLFNIDQAKDVVEILKLSYYHLPENLQMCFRFCSIFPQDHLFDKIELIEMWMACGFISSQSSSPIKRPEDIGEDYFNQLLGKSFFELSKKIGQGLKPKNKKKMGPGYIMHDLLHELAQTVSIGECCRVAPSGIPAIIPSTVRHVFVYGSEINRISHLENLRSLIITYPWNDSFVFQNNILKQTLRLIIIKRNWDLSYKFIEDISCLLHLRYLSIRETYVAELWKYLLPSIYGLYHLQVLEVEGSRTCPIVATEFANLVRLRHMRIPNEIVQTIRGVHKLTSLEELTFFVGHENGSRINELGTLKNLRHLCIENIENVRVPAEVKCADLLGMEHLISLILKWSSESNCDNPEQIMDCLQSHPELRELTIDNYIGQKSPGWMENSPYLNLSSLKIFNCPIWKNQLFSWQMPVLKILEICNCPNLNTVPNLPLSLVEIRVDRVGLTSLPYLNGSFGNNILQPSSLKVVEIRRCPYLISLNGFLQQENLSLQAVEKLFIWECEMLELIPEAAFGKLSSLIHLKIHFCPNLINCPSLPLSLVEFHIANVGVSVLPEYYQSLSSSGDTSASSLKSSLKTVMICNCTNLTSLNGFLEQLLSWQMPVLEILKIHNCPNLNTVSNLPLSLIEIHVDRLGLTSLPYLNRSFGNNILQPSSLKVVEIRRCPYLISLNGFLQQENLDLRAIERLFIWECERLELIPEGAFGKLSSLKHLNIYFCPNLINCPSLPLSLAEFHIANVRLSALPEYYQSLSSSGDTSASSLKSSLRTVMICNCTNLTSLNGFLEQENVNFHAVQNIRIYFCENLVQLPLDSFGKFVSLKHLSLKNCPNLTELPNLPLSLSEFAIYNVGLSSLPEYYQISSSSSCSSASLLKSSLKEVTIFNCQNLTSLNGFMQQDNIDFQSMERMELSNCQHLVHPPIGAFGKFGSLTKLRIHNCPMLVAVD